MSKDFRGAFLPGGIFSWACVPSDHTILTIVTQEVSHAISTATVIHRLSRDPAPVIRPLL